MAGFKWHPRYEPWTAIGIVFPHGQPRECGKGTGQAQNIASVEFQAFRFRNTVIPQNASSLAAHRTMSDDKHIFV